jgi:putative ABC transport system permease protein
MLRKNIQVAFRNFFKNKVSATINIIGLSISIMLAIHLSLFVINELSYDRFHKDHDRIYRILSELSSPGERTELYSICQGQLPLIVNNIIPEVEACVRIYYNDRIAFECNDKRFNDNHIIYTDSTFFDVFSFKLLSGNPHQDLSTKSNLYMSQSLALKVFGKADLVGKIVTTKYKTYTIAGVFEDIPKNSHLQFDLITGLSEVENLVKHSGLEFLTYVELKKNANKEIGIKKVCDKYDEFLKGFWTNKRYKCIGHAQTLTNIWLHSDNVSYDVPHGNINNIYIAGVLIVFILVIAIVNFINLAIIQAEDRAKEIGIRKMSGASRGNIRYQFMSEAFLIIILSVIFAIILTRLTQPVFNNLTGKLITLSFSNTTKLFFALVALCLIICIVAGYYPSFYLSKFPVTRNLKGGSSEGKKTSTLSKVLVFLQFSIVIFLISNLLVFYKQMKFIRNSDMGFQMEQVVGITDQNGGIYKSYEAIKQSLLQNPGILNVSLAQGISSENLSGQYAKRCADGETKEILVKQNRTTYDFIKTFNIKLIDGRDFDIDMSTDNNSFIINETAKKELNLPANAIGQRLVLNQDTGKVIGVVKDYHYASLHDKIEPLFITLNKPNLNNPLWGIIFIRLKPGYITEGLNFITQTLQKIDHHYILEYEFVDDHFNAQYKSDSKINNMIFFATSLSIFIALMGLVALASVTIAKRTKEIGIRKIFGESVSGIIILLLNDIIKWVLLANVIALPISYFTMQKWLLNFAYRISFPFSVLFFAGIMAVSIASLAIINKVFKTAIQNPINALRYE